MGLSAAQIARGAHTKKATVEHALRVAATTLTAAATHKYGLTLDQALVITEFEDAPDLVAALTARRAALPKWLHEYNHHRPHSAIGKVPPITRLTNLPGQYI